MRCQTITQTKKALDTQFAKRRQAALSAVDTSMNTLQAAASTSEKKFRQSQELRSKAIEKTFSELDTHTGTLKASILKNNIATALTRERAAIDSVLVNANASLMSAYEERKQSITDAIDVYKSSVDTAFALAQAQCVNGVFGAPERAMLKKSVVTAKETLLNSLRSIPTLTEHANQINTDTLTRITNAQQTFKTTTDRILANFKTLQ